MTPPDATVSVPVARGDVPIPLPATVLAASPGPLDSTLRRIVSAAVRLTDATYGALGVLAPDGRHLDRFVVVGMGEEDRARIGRPPTGLGVLGVLVDRPEVLRLDDLATHPASTGFPPGHPPMRSLLGVPVLAGGAVFGHLYLTEKRTGGPFTDADVAAVQALAEFGGPALEQARQTEATRLRQVWARAGAEAAVALLAGSDPSAALHEVTARVGELLSADLTGLLLPTPGDERSLTIAAAHGLGAADWEAVRVPVTDTHVGRVHRSGTAAVVDDVSADPGLGRHAPVAAEIARPLGPGILAPLGSGPLPGVVVAMRARGSEPFDPALLEPVTAFAAQAGAALTLSRRQERESRLQVQAERDRIARDLHDHVVQRIFATALSLDRLSRSLEHEHPDAAGRLSRSVDELDSTIAEIRAAIFELQEQYRVPPATLRAQLSEVVRQVTEGHPLRRDVRVRGAVDDLPAELVPDIIAVVRELVTNVVRHASASRVTVTVHAEDEVRVVVTDDGVGLRAGTARSGLANLADRAERRGGRLSTVARPVGTQLRWAVPRL